MQDVLEGLDRDGFITTGIARSRVPAAFEPLLAQVVAAAGTSPCYLYGSLATGRDRLGISDVDLVVLGGGAEHAKEIADELSAQHQDLTSGISIGGWTDDDLGESDAGYGNRVFLRHYCVHLGGPDISSQLPPFRGDERAARGFNGDIDKALSRWRRALAPDSAPSPRLARSVGRKTLFAVAGLVSAHDRTWTTDRATAARRWAQIHPSMGDDLCLLLVLGDGPSPEQVAELPRLLDEVVPRLVDQFSDDIGLWT